MDRGAWRAAVRRTAESRTRLKRRSLHSHTRMLEHTHHHHTRGTTVWACLADSRYMDVSAGQTDTLIP